MKQARHNAGFILLAPLLAAVALTGSWLLNASPGDAQATTSTSHALANAREALISRAVTDDNRPGSLPCPDQATDSAGFANTPGDGKADMLTRNRCPAALGRLPWVTLDIPAPHDNAQQLLWYLAAPGLRDDDSAMPINGDTPSGLQIDSGREIAALLIAPGPVLRHQSRPSHEAADYIEGELEEGDELVFRPVPGNDTILSIGRDELMAAVSQRVAGEVLRCLQSHAARSGSLPFPAPPGDHDGRGRATARFGRIPATQPADGLAVRMQQLGEQLDTITTAGQVSPETPPPPETIPRLQDMAEWIEHQLDANRQVGDEVRASAENASACLSGLQDAIIAAAANGRIAKSEGIRIRQLGGESLVALAEVDDALVRFGLDPLAGAQEAESAPNRTRAHLNEARQTLTAALAHFTSLDTASPRPVQRTLVAPATAISAPSAANAAIVTQIATLGAALAAEASRIRRDAEALIVATSREGQALDLLQTYQEQPTERNLQRAQEAVTRALIPAGDLSTALKASRTLEGTKQAAAWPMVWAARACAFLRQADGWWQNNRWQEELFYQIAPPGSARLSANGKSQLSVVVVAAGARRDGQQRPGTRISDYLEGINADPGRDGDAASPATEFTSHFAQGAGNDRLAF